MNLLDGVRDFADTIKSGATGGTGALEFDLEKENDALLLRYRTLVDRVNDMEGEIEALSDERVVQLACGGAHSAALTADGTLYMWGKNHNGQLGHGDVTSLDEPARVQSLGQRVAWVACGGSHTACLLCCLRAGLYQHYRPAAGGSRSLTSPLTHSGRPQGRWPSQHWATPPAAAAAALCD